jgi:hypothetical protein
LLAIAGGVVLGRRRPAHLWPLLATVVAVSATTMITYGNQRFRAGAEPAVVALAAVALVAAFDRFRPQRTAVVPAEVEPTGVGTTEIEGEPDEVDRSAVEPVEAEGPEAGGAEAEPAQHQSPEGADGAGPAVVIEPAIVGTDEADGDESSDEGGGHERDAAEEPESDPTSSETTSTVN